MFKKYVMVTRNDGLSDIVVDEQIADDSTVDLWINPKTPADLDDHNSRVTPGAVVHEPPAGGAIFRLIKFTKAMDTLTPETVVAMHNKIHSKHVPSVEYLKAAKHPSMHRTDTLNYFVVLSGKMWALSEGKDVLLEPGDFIIQTGCIHGWKVEGDEPCMLAAVLIDGVSNAGQA